MIQLFLLGSNGRMGQSIQTVFHAQSEYAENFILKCLNRQTPLADFVIHPQDVVIDYTLPDATDGLLDQLEKRSFKLVSGTTGLSSAQKARLISLSKNRSIFWAPNTSLGVEVFKRMVAQFQFLPDFQFQIQETHHVHKKDRPSGTALALQEELERAVGHAVPTPESRREGDVLGNHTVTATGKFERLELTHLATSRQAFAEGALKVARWICHQPNGFYQMKDLTEIQ